MIIRPSSAHAWFGPNGCAAYPTMASKYRDRAERGDHTARDEGILAHEVAEVWFNEHVPPSRLEDLPDDLQDDVGEYVRYLRECSGVSLVHVEQTFDLSHWLGPNKQGTADAVAFAGRSVIDLKTGRRDVPARRNVQLSIYALAAFGTDHPVELVIFQPRSGGLKTWTATPEYLRDFEQELIASVERVKQPNPTARSGGHCLHCPALFTCSAAFAAGVDVFEAATATPDYEQTPAELGARLSMLRGAMGRIKALEAAYTAEVDSLIQLGTSVRGWQRETKQTPLKWKDKNTLELFVMGDLLGIDLRKTPDAITPTQAKRAGIPPDVLAKFAQRENITKLIQLKNIEDQFNG